MTKNEPFTLLDGKSIDISMMRQSFQYQYAEDDNIQIMELPYTGNELSMVILLSPKTVKWDQFENQLTVKNLNKWFAKLRRQQVIVAIPKFKTTFGIELTKTLATMGMPEAFSLKADFSGMDGSHYLYISAVIHKAFVDVNEAGTEAAAATAVVMTLKSALIANQVPVFCADHPFIFLIRDIRSGSILFIGRILDPSK